MKLSRQQMSEMRSRVKNHTRYMFKEVLRAEVAEMRDAGYELADNEYLLLGLLHAAMGGLRVGFNEFFIESQKEVGA